MGKPIASQHPAVVLRSHYVQLRALLAVATIAVVGLTVAVVILATNDGGGTSASSAGSVSAPAPATPGQRYAGGPEAATRGVLAVLGLEASALVAPAAVAGQDLRAQDALDAARSLPPNQLAAVSQGLRSSTTQDLRAQDALDAARSLPPNQLAAVSQGLRSSTSE